MKTGTKLTAIDPCADKFTKEHTLTIGKSYDVEFVSAYGFSITNDAGNLHHFGHESLETYFQSITPESLEELGFEKRMEFDKTIMGININGFKIEVVQKHNVYLNHKLAPSCKTLTDLKHLIRILGV